MKGPRHLSLSLAMDTTTVRTAAGTYGGTSITAIGVDVPDGDERNKPVWSWADSPE